MGRCDASAGWLLRIFVFVGVVFAVPDVGIAQQSERQELEDLSDRQKRTVLSHVKAGKRAYEAGNYETSRAEFRAAYAILRHPDFAYRLGLAHEKLGNPKRAIDYYRAFLELDPDAEERANVERRIEALEQALRGELSVESSPSGATVRAADREDPFGETPLETEIPAGNYELVVAKSGHRSHRETVEVVAGETEQLVIELEASAQRGERSRPRDGSARPGAGPFVLMGVGGGVSAAVSVVSFLQFQSFRSEVDAAHRSEGGRPGKPDDYEADLRRAKTWERAAWVAGGIGLVSVASGLAWTIAATGSSESEGRGRALGFGVQPAVEPRGGGVQLHVRGAF